MEDIIYCNTCGTSNHISARFCQKCGSPINTTAVPESNRSNFITLTCPVCGGKLEITPDIDKYVCTYCGHEHLVRRSRNEVSLTPVIEGLDKVASKIDQAFAGSDRQAAEQTIARLKNEIPLLQEQIKNQEDILNSFKPAKEKRKRAFQQGIFFMIFGVLLIVFALVYTLQCAITPNHCNSSSVRIIFAFGGLAVMVIGIIFIQKNKHDRSEIMNPEYDRVNMELQELQRKLLTHQSSLEALHRYTTSR